jgi:hypothetical protein
VQAEHLRPEGRIAEIVWQRHLEGIDPKFAAWKGSLFEVIPPVVGMRQ